MNPLNETARIGRYTLRNRLIMALMTGSGADDSGGAQGDIDYPIPGQAR
jgi:N-ethylmaleimide reductase